MLSSSLQINNNCKISLDSDLSTSVNNKESISISLSKEKENDLSLIDPESLSLKIESFNGISSKNNELCILVYEHIIEIILNFKDISDSVEETKYNGNNISNEKNMKKSKISNFLNNKETGCIKNEEKLMDDMEFYKITDFSKNILFYNKRFPSIQLQEYICRIVKYAKLEESEIVFMAKLIDEIASKNIIISLRNVMRIINGCVIITLKYLNDKKFNKDFYCKLFIEDWHNINVIENVILDILEYRLKTIEDQIENFKEFLYKTYDGYL